MLRRFGQLIILLVATVPLFLGGTASAASNGLGITPRKDYTIKAGGSVSDTLFLNNLSTTQALNVSIRVIDFKAANESGTPSLLLVANAPQTPWSLKPFISLPSTVTVPAGKATYVPFTIAIPAKQGAGSYYSAIEYTAQNAQNQQKVNVAASSATLMFVTVPGTAHELMTLQQFGTFAPNLNDTTGTSPGIFRNWFIGAQPQDIGYRLQNDGNVAEDPQGSITIKNMFGQTVEAIEKANPSGSLALIGQTRLFDTCIVGAQQTITASNGQTVTDTICRSPGLSPGRYTAELGVLYGISGSNSQEVTGSATFWYLPWWSVVVIVFILLVLFFFAGKLYRKLRH
jgi:hypothetical protein